MRIKIREDEFVLCAERAIFWPKHRVLFCSDLHWGREAYLQSKGFAIPDRNFDLEANTLKSLLKNLGAVELWILGDFIHHPEGLHPELVERMRVWIESLRSETAVTSIKLIPGNHDKLFLQWASKLPLELHENGIVRDGFIFVHDESEVNLKDEVNSKDQFCFSGHLHPAFYPPMLGSEKLPCFWIRQDRAYLPAYSRLAGGMEIGKLKPTDRVYVIADKQVIEI
jgi:DNA ligase-associated metallophosphoesterase